MIFSRKTLAVNTDAARIDELLTRGVERIYPSAEFLTQRLRSGERLTLYLGIDPTGPTLHLGHLIPLLKLRQFQALGHRSILLIGDFTGMVGDPTDKQATRKRLTREEVLSNARRYKDQAGRIVSFDGPNPAELKHNSEWLGSLTYADFHTLASLVTVEQFIKRDMFEGRQKAGKPIYLHEFVYPLLQGYDSIALETDGEVGGTDQTFNMLVGRDLVRALQKREKFVIATKLLVDSAGKKMGKTERNLVALSDSPAECFGKIMSWQDGMIISGFELCTAVPLSGVAKMKGALERGENPKEIKLQLAEALVSLLSGPDAAQKARAAFTAAFTGGKPEEFVEISLSGRAAGAALVAAGVVSSKSDLRRLITEGAVTNLDTDAKMGEAFLEKADPGKYRIGKHRFIQIK